MVYRDDPDLPSLDNGAVAVAVADGGGGGGYSDALPDGGGSGGGERETSGTTAAAAATLEVPRYSDNPTTPPDAGAYVDDMAAPSYEDMAPASVGTVGYTSPKRASRGKLIVGACIVGAIAIGVFVHSSSNKSKDSSASASEASLRGSNSNGGTCEDDASYIHTNGKTCANFVAHVGRINLRVGRCGQDTGKIGSNGQELLVEDFCRASCGLCDDDDGMGEEEDYMAEINEEMNEVEAVKPAAAAPPAAQEVQEEVAPPAAPVPPPPAPKPKPEHTTYLPKKDKVCEDDATYVHSNGKSCNNFIGHVGRPALHDSRCNQGTGNLDKKGNELLLKHYCRKSCTYCNAEDAAAADEVHAEHIKSDEAYKLDHEQHAAEYAAAAKAAAEQAAAEKAAAEQAAAEQAAAEQAAAEQAEQAAAEQAAAEQAAAEQAAAEQAAAEQAASEQTAAAQEEQEQEEETGGDSTSEGKVNEPTFGDEVPPAASEPEEVAEPSMESTSEEMDFFVPLTTAERDAMKAELRATLKLTKDALAAGSGVLTQRALVLDPETPKQFMHLLNEQTGGESVNDLIKCSVGRQAQITSISGSETSVLYSAIVEDKNLDMCRKDLANRLGVTVNDGEFFTTNDNGMLVLFDPSDTSSDIPPEQRNACDTVDAHVMTYGSNLRAVEQFGWHDVESITMIADPVVRTLQVYQKTAEACYGCRVFKDILMGIHDGTFESDDEICKSQMIGHQAMHLLSSPDLILAASDTTFPREQEIVNEAVRNLREGVTWIGILDETDESVRGFKEVFPWLSDNLEGAAAALPQELASIGVTAVDDRFALPADYHDATSCIFEHKEEDHYTCGSRDVGADELEWIKKLNMRDTAVYRAAVERFAIQKEVLDEYHQAVNAN